MILKISSLWAWKMIKKIEDTFCALGKIDQEIKTPVITNNLKMYFNVLQLQLPSAEASLF